MTSLTFFLILVVVILVLACYVGYEVTMAKLAPLVKLDLPKTLFPTGILASSSVVTDKFVFENAKTPVKAPIQPKLLLTKSIVKAAKSNPGGSKFRKFSTPAVKFKELFPRGARVTSYIEFIRALEQFINRSDMPNQEARLMSIDLGYDPQYIRKVLKGHAKPSTAALTEILQNMKDLANMGTDLNVDQIYPLLTVKKAR